MACMKQQRFCLCNKTVAFSDAVIEKLPLCLRLCNFVLVILKSNSDYWKTNPKGLPFRIDKPQKGYLSMLSMELLSTGQPPTRCFKA